jgi:hypothetical protein
MENKEVKITENKKILVKPIDKDRAFFPKGHDGKVRYTGCNYDPTLPWITNERRYVDIFGGKEVQNAFEKALFLEPGTLNLYNRKGSWWSKFNVTLTKETKELDLNEPMHALEYRVLMANEDTIAKSMSDYNGIQLFFLEDESVSEEENFSLSEKKVEAMEIFMKLRKSDKKMYDILRVLGKSPAASMESNKKALIAELTSIISQVEKVTGMPNIDDFIAANNDALFQDKVFVYDALAIGEVELIDGTYKMSGNGQPLGKSITEVAEYFHAPKHQDDKLLVQQRIELNK